MIKKSMTLQDIITEVPESAIIMAKYGLHCIGCHVAAWETLENGAKAHGLSDKTIEKMVREINDVSGGKDGKKKNR